MRTSYGRIVFGASAVLFGVIALRWHDSDTWQTMHKIWNVPFGTAIGGILMVAQVAGGIGITLPQTARSASMVLAVVYSLFSLVCVSAIVAHPAVYAEYGSFFEQFALVNGAVAVYAVTEVHAKRSAVFGSVTRLGLGLCAISFTLSQVIYFRITADLVPSWIPPNQAFWAIVTTAAFALAAVAVLIDRSARPAMRLMGVMIALFGVLVWIPLLIAHPESHTNWSEFALNFLICGAAWNVADLQAF